MLSKRFPSKRAFVTGAASGLGFAICERLAREGWRIMISDVNEERLNEAEQKLEKLGATIISSIVNVSSYDALEAAAAQIKQAWGGVDMVFNNAGIASAGVFEDISLDEWNRVINIDLWSVIYGCKVFVPMLKEQGSGYIINTASSAGTLAVAEMANYNVAKAGVVSLSETLKVELSPHNIGVTVICPTVFKTNLTEKLSSGSAFEKNLEDQMQVTKIMPSHIVDYTFKVMAKNKLYAMPQNDAYWGWKIKRYFPELYTKLVSYCYAKRIWIFKCLD
jgi:NAD(P)-dependent dehydrogenase (short-subunit alcohol dehydrogenase family)